MIFTRLVLPLLALAGLMALYFWAALSWNYSSGERAGWVQKLSNKGWLCKTWEGELALVSLPGSTPEKFVFTIRDEAVAQSVTKVMGKRVALHYEEKVGLPTSSSAPMQRGRWYPTVTTMAQGEMVTVSGKDQSGVIVPVPEVWTNGVVRRLTTASLTLPYYPITFMEPREGRLFYAGEERTTRFLDTRGTGKWTTVAQRRFGTRDYGSAVMYDVGKVLYAGGGRTTNTAETIDLNSATPGWKWTGSMAYPRRHLNTTVLPTGEVLVTSGTGGDAFNDLTRIVRAAEMWNPATGLWTTLASARIPRAYHSTAILLPDARVLVSGGGDGGKSAIQ
ncbi:MAG: hypothetical protein H7Z19_04475, partial [Chitinophagaceae bacterium]|nr:hypothetical protein [Rubrivivax sp.]